VRWVRVLGDVEILLDHPSCVGQKRPVSTNAGTKLIRLRQVVGAHSDQPAMPNLHLTMKLNQSLRLPTVFRAEPTSAQHQHQRMRPLQLGELPTLRSVIGQFIVRKYRSRHNIRSHEIQTPSRNNTLHSLYLIANFKPM
jgi:hypothetical protein